MSTQEEIKPATNQAELEALVELYIAKGEQRRNLTRQIDDLQSPAPVKVTNSFEEMSAYHQRIVIYEENRRYLEEQRHTLSTELELCGLALIRSLPVSRTWVRAGKYAIGKYYSTWGGGHSELDLLDWSEDLPEIKDSERS